MTNAEKIKTELVAAAKAAHKTAVAEGRICACEGPHGIYCGAAGIPAIAKLEV